MKTTLLLLAGVSLGLASWLLTGSNNGSNRGLKRGAGSVEDLTKNLQQAWSDHHTVA